MKKKIEKKEKAVISSIHQTPRRVQTAEGKRRQLMREQKQSKAKAA